jgi:hypothetical protein
VNTPASTGIFNQLGMDEQDLNGYQEVHSFASFLS